MKHCHKCDTTKNTSEFYKNKSTKDGFQAQCKSCGQQLRKDNPEKLKQQNAQWRSNNVERDKQNRARWKKDNANRNKQTLAQWKKDNADKQNAYGAKRRAAEIQRTVPWANLNTIRAFYTEAQRLTNETGVVHHVDHILPLQGTNVSGLHIETNLQVLPYYENLSKSNNYEIA